MDQSWKNRWWARAQDAWFRQVEPWRLASARKRDCRRQRKNTPLVSFPIATYNRGQILCERTIPSILNQTYSNLEIIVVGDQVIDDTKERIAALRDTRVKFIDLPRRGQYPATPKERWFVAGTVPRNVGSRLAQGDWIYMISDDDVLYPAAVEKMVTFAEREGLESVTAAFDYPDQGVKKVRRAEQGIASLGFATSGIPAWMYRSYLKCFPWNRHSWKKAWNRPCDYDLMLRMRRCGVRMGYLDEVVALKPAVEGTNCTGSAAQLEIATDGGATRA
jgi:glycosyltransferase involved in cell wall biosynthesis